MPVCPHHAHVNSRRSTGCVMSLFTTRGQWIERSAAILSSVFPCAREDLKCVSVCVMSLCISLCLLERERGWGLSGGVREWRWANEQARENFVYVSAQRSSEVFLALFFFPPWTSSAVFPVWAKYRSFMHFPIVPCNGDTHDTQILTHTHPSVFVCLRPNG